MTVKPDFIKWCNDDSAAKITDPGSTKKLAGFLYKEKPPFQYVNYLFNRLWKWLLGLQGSYYDVVIGSAAQVTAKEATNEIDDLDDALAVAGARVLFLDGTHTLTGNLNLSNDDLKIIAESPLSILDIATFTATFSGDDNLISLKVINAGTDDIIVSGSGSSFIGLNVDIDSVAVSGGAVAKTSGTTGGIKTGKMYENGFDVINADELFNALAAFAGGNWTEQASGATTTLNAVSWNGSLFCAVGIAAGDSYILTSPNGITWTERANPKNFDLNGITWNGSIFCAVGDADGTDAYIITSPDGTTWLERGNPKNFNLNDISWNGSVFCAVGNPDGTDSYIVTSPDGIAWTERANPANRTLNGITWGNSLFVAVGQNTGTDSYIITSPDGTTWTERANPIDKQLNSVAWNGSLFCAVGVADGTDAAMITSPDAITWTEQANPLNIALQSIAAAGSIFCAVGNSDGTDAYIVTSPDGIAWTEKNNPKTASLNGVTWNGKQFCAVGFSDGVDTYILTSLSF